MRSLLFVICMSLLCSFISVSSIDDFDMNSSSSSTLVAEQGEPSNQFRGKFRNENLKLNLVLNLYAANIPIPGLEMDSCYGYLHGNINGSWAILKVKNIETNRAIVRMVSDRGSDAQDVELVITDSGLTFRQVDDVNIKGVANGKYVKLPKIIDFIKN